MVSERIAGAAGVPPERPVAAARNDGRTGRAARLTQRTSGYFRASLAGSLLASVGVIGMVASGTGPVPAVARAAAEASGLGAGPDGSMGMVVFDRFDAPGGAEGPHLGAFLVGADGGAERPIPLPTEVWELVPFWSPDGRLVVNLIGPTSQPFRPAIVGLDGSDLEVIEVDTDLDVVCSDWSPDGARLVCTAGAEGRPEVDGIYTVAADGSDLVRLTTSPYHYTEGTAGQCGGGQNRGAYSPDGTSIAFIEQQCGRGPDPSSTETASIVSIAADGTDRREIVSQGGVMSHPGSQLSWSPDGSWIAFVSPHGQLYKVHPDGSGMRRVQIEGGWHGRFATGPDWSPDGDRIVFSMYSDSSGSSDLHTVSLDGSGLRQITDAPGAEAWARWAPGPIP